MRVLLANLYSANNRGDYLIVRGTIELLRKLGVDLQLSGMTTFRSSSLSHLEDDLRPYREILERVEGNPSGVVLSPIENESAGSLGRLSAAVGGVARVIVGVSRAHLNPRGQDRSSQNVPISPHDFDVVVFVGGAYLDACTIRDYALLLSHLYPAYLAGANRVPYLFLGESICGGGPLVPRLLLRAAFSHADLVVFRETLSFEEARQSHLVEVTSHRQVSVFPDLAFGLAGTLRPHRTPRAAHSPITVGVAFRQWSATRVNRLTDDPAKTIAQVLVRVAKRRPIRYRLLPFSSTTPSANDDDHRSCQQLEQEVRAADPSVDIAMVELPPPEDLEGLARVFGAFDFNVCVRMHATIFSAMLGVPSITIEYRGRKSQGVCRYLGLEEYYLSTLSVEGLERLVLAMADKYVAVSRDIVPSVERLSESLHSSLLPQIGRVFGRLAQVEHTSPSVLGGIAP